MVKNSKFVSRLFYLSLILVGLCVGFDLGGKAMKVVFLPTILAILFFAAVAIALISGSLALARIVFYGLPIKAHELEDGDYIMIRLTIESSLYQIWQSHLPVKITRRTMDDNQAPMYFSDLGLPINIRVRVALATQTITETTGSKTIKKIQRVITANWEEHGQNQTAAQIILLDCKGGDHGKEQ